MKTVLEVVDGAIEYFTKRGVENPRRQAQEVIGFVLGIAPLDLYLNFERPLDEEELAKCREILSRRGKREPMPYIREEIEFLGTSIAVSPDVLIPRQETENFVASLIDQLKGEGVSRGKILWDICTGSGCIAIALKKALPELEVVASDISSAALSIAQKNALANGVDVTFCEGDLFHPFSGKNADFIVCNPPYISEDEYLHLEPEVKQFEPKSALVPGKTGLEFYQRFASEYRNYLNPGGKLWLEMGSKQADALQTLFGSDSEMMNDWAGHPRTLAIAN